MVGIVAAFAGQAGLAISNSIGGIAAQTVFLVVADITYRRANLEHAAASLTNVFSSFLLLALLAIVAMAIAAPRRDRRRNSRRLAAAARRLPLRRHGRTADRRGGDVGAAGDPRHAARRTAAGPGRGDDGRPLAGFLAYGGFFAAAGPADTFVVGWAALLTAIAGAGLLRRQRQGIGFEGVAILAIYLLGVPAVSLIA